MLESFQMNTINSIVACLYETDKINFSLIRATLNKIKLVHFCLNDNLKKYLKQVIEKRYRYVLPWFVGTTLLMWSSIVYFVYCICLKLN